MDLLDEVSSIKENFKKCGEITTALKVGKKVYALNCGFCSKVFIRLHAFTLHIGENHEQELFECLEDESFEVMSVDERKEDILTKLKDEKGTTEATTEIKCIDMIQEGGTCANNFQDPLEHVIFEEIPNILDVKKEAEVMEHEGYYDDDGDENMETNDDAENKFDCSEATISSKNDNEQDDLSKKNGTKAFDKEVVLATIKGYKKHSVLWDANYSSPNSREQEIEAYTSIANSINKQMTMNLKWNTIQNRIIKLRHKFHSELQKQMLAKLKGEDYTPIWYYDELLFLNTSVKYKQQSRKSKKLLKNELPKLTDVQSLELIEIYKSFPCLWNVHHIGFRFTNRRQEAMNDMMHEIKARLNLNIAHDQLQKIIDGLRDSYSQEKHTKIKCEQQKTIFTPMFKFYEQVSFLNDNVSPFKCNFCEETFKGFNVYSTHKSTHDGSMPFICPVCNHGFMKASNYTVHLRRHTLDYPFECKICQKRYPGTSELKRHMRGHTGEKPYFCEICGQSFRTWGSFDNHMRRHQKRPLHICTICSKGFYDKTKLTEHINGHLNIRNKVCNVCGKAFTSSKYLQQHKLIHAEKKKYACKICKKDFAQFAGLSMHMKSHGTAVSGNPSAIMG